MKSGRTPSSNITANGLCEKRALKMNYRFFHTLDGMYEGFGFYNIYGFSGMMPVFWTLQTQYLAKHPKEMSPLALACIIAMYTIGWCVRFTADYQKLRFRQTGGKYSIWGKNAKGIRASYQTTDGKVRESLLLSSGEFLYRSNAVFTISHGQRH